MRECGIAAFAHDAAKSGHQLRSGRAHLVVMMKSQLAEDLLTFRSKREQNLATIILRAGAMDKPSGFQTIH